MFVIEAGLATALPAQPTELKTWAVLSTDDVRNTGIPDLLFHEMSAAGISLVERDRISDVLKEIELSSLQEPNSAASRQRAGRLLKADILLLLSKTKREDDEFYRMVATDTRYGCRLSTEQIAVSQSADHIEAAVQQLLREIQTTQKRFRSGVRSIVALPPFLSRNLTHDFDHLQFAFSELLGQSLLKVEGTAIVEIQEADSIRVEQSLTGGNIVSPVVSVIVNAEFRVVRQWDQATARQLPAEASKAGVGTMHKEHPILFSVSADVNGRKKQLSHEALNIMDATHWIRSSLPAELLQDFSAVPARTNAEFSRELIERAEAFSRLALLRESTALREAVLLLSPDSWQQRLRLYKEYRKLKVVLHHRVRDTQRNSIEHSQAVREQQQIWTSLRHHLDVILSTAPLNPVEATYLIDVHMRDVGNSVESMPDDASGFDEIRDFFWRHTARIAQMNAEFRRGEAHPEIAPTWSTRKNFTDEGILGYFAEYSMKTFHHGLPLIANRWKRDYHNTQMTQDIRRFIVDILPDNRIPSSFSEFLTLKYPPLSDGTPIADPDKVIDLYDALSNSINPLHQFYGLYGTQSLKLQSLSKQPAAASDLKQIAHMNALISRWELEDPAGRANSAAIARQAIRRLQIELDARFSESSVKLHAYTPRYLQRNATTGAIAFEPVPEVVLQSMHTRLVKAGPGVDVIWSDSEVAVMTAPGVIRRIFQVDSGSSTIYDVACDRQNIWIASAAEGLQVFDLHGTRLTVFNSDGHSGDCRTALPPLPNRVMAVHQNAARKLMPVLLFCPDINRCIISADLQPDGRRWYAEVQRLDAGWTSRVLLEATDSGTTTERNGIPDSVAPACLLRYTTKDSDCVIAIFRNFGKHPRDAIAFDLQSGAAKQIPGLRLPQWYDAVVAVQHNDHILAVGDSVARLTPGATPDESWTSQELPCDADPSRRVVRGRMSGPIVYPTDDGPVIPGTHWYRLEPGAQILKTLTVTPMPLSQRFPGHADSEHYGRVAWDIKGRLFRIHLDGDHSQETRDTWELYFIPEKERQSHIAARSRLRLLGADVETRDVTRIPSAYGQKLSAGWQTFVYLPAEWSGTDADLECLKDLYNLRVLYLVKATIGDDEMKAIGRLKDLEILTLEGTNVTDAGLRHLSGMNSLSYLRLDGTARQFSDDGLDHLCKLPMLKSLLLYGPGFTDQGVTTLAERSMINQATLVATKVTREGMLNATKLSTGRGLPFLFSTTAPQPHSLLIY